MKLNMGVLFCEDGVSHLFEMGLKIILPVGLFK